MAGIWGRAKGALEAGATLASGAVAEPVAGWAGILNGGDAGAVQRTRQALTYAPKTPEGQQAVQGIGDILGKLKDAAMASPIGSAVNGFNAVADKAGATSPVLGAAVKTAPAALAMLFGPGGTATRSAVGNVAKGTAQGVERAAITAADNAAAIPAMRGPMAHEKGIFAGHLSKEAPIWKLEQAKTMQALGKSDREIYQHTGWFAGSADGKWRYEIPDNEAALTDKAAEIFTPGEITVGAKFKGNLPDALTHDAVMAAYPFAKNIDVQSTPSLEGASYMSSESPFLPPGERARFIKVAQSGADPKSSMLHELQHAIQEHEGFARGGSVDANAVPYDQLVRRSNQAQDSYIRAQEAGGIDPETGLSAESIRQSIEQYSDAINNWVDPYEQYRRLAGEAEARLVQARMAMTPEERAASYPPDMYDVPVKDQLVRY